MERPHQHLLAECSEQLCHWPEWAPHSPSSSVYKSAFRNSLYKTVNKEKYAQRDFWDQNDSILWISKTHLILFIRQLWQNKCHFSPPSFIYKRLSNEAILEVSHPGVGRRLARVSIWSNYVCQFPGEMRWCNEEAPRSGRETCLLWLSPLALRTQALELATAHLPVHCAQLLRKACLWVRGLDEQFICQSWASTKGHISSD
jgi:hypothetical protein